MLQLRKRKQSPARAACRHVADLEPPQGLAVSSRSTARIWEQAVFGRDESGLPGLAELDRRQKRIADYWADGAATVTPPGHWNQIAIDLVSETGWSTLRTAWLFATLNTAQQVAIAAYHVDR